MNRDPALVAIFSTGTDWGAGNQGIRMWPREKNGDILTLVQDRLRKILRLGEDSVMSISQ